jgi:hypothetical protein
MQPHCHRPCSDWHLKGLVKSLTTLIAIASILNFTLIAKQVARDMTLAQAALNYYCMTDILFTAFLQFEAHDTRH